MKNTLFTGIVGENPAVLINREQAPGIGKLIQAFLNRALTTR